MITVKIKLNEQDQKKALLGKEIEVKISASQIADAVIKLNKELKSLSAKSRKRFGNIIMVYANFDNQDQVSIIYCLGKYDGTGFSKFDYCIISKEDILRLRKKKKWSK